MPTLLRNLSRMLSELADDAIDDQSSSHWTDGDVVASMKVRARRMKLNLNDFQDEVFHAAASKRVHARAKPIPAPEQLRLYDEQMLSAIIIPLGLDDTGTAQRVRLPDANLDALNIKMDHEIEQLEDISARLGDIKKTIALVRPLMQADPAMTFAQALRKLGYLAVPQNRGNADETGVPA